jgi:hypothetical protein
LFHEKRYKGSEEQRYKGFFRKGQRFRGTKVLNLIISYENECPSPDGRENPFVPVPRLREAQKIGRTAGIAPNEN